MPFSFLNAAILTGIAAGALPILIHLFSRRKITRIPFSSLQFLEQISRRRVKRVRLTQWIILALRVLAIALLAFALSRPAFRGDFALGKSRGESAVAVLLDRSFSMAADGAAESLWDKAKARTEEVLDVLETRDRVFFVGVDPRDDAVDAYPDPLSARDALRGMEVGYGATDLESGIRRAAGALAQATALNKELFIVSDFQTSGIPGGVDLGVTDLGRELPPEVRVFLLPVDEGRIPNTAIEDARAEGSAVEQRIRAIIARHGNTSVDDLAVTVESSGDVLGEYLTSLGGDTRHAADVVLSRLPGAGESLITRISRDRLPVDDVRYVPPMGAGRVVAAVVQEPAQQSPFLPLALSPGEAGGRFEVRRIAPEELGRSERRQAVDLSDIRLLVLDNVTSLPREALSRLRAWREAGGLLFVALGDRVDLRYYNEDLLPALFPGVSLGNLLGTDEATGTSYSLVPRSPGHIAFGGFETTVGQPLTGASFWKIVEVKADAEVRTLAEFGPGLPALVEGSGSLLFASSLDGKWNNFPTHAAFLPLIHQSLESILQRGGDELAAVGEPVQGTVERSEVPAGAELLCTGPAGLELAVQTRVVSRGMQLWSAPAPQPGFYEMRAGDRVLFRRAVNVDPVESDLTPLPHAELRALFTGDRVKLLEPETALRAPVREARYGREFWREMVAMVLILAVTEAWLARRGVV